MSHSLRGKTMNPIRATLAFGQLDILYIEDVSSTTLRIVCAPEMRATQAELTAAMEAIGTRKSVFDARQGTAQGDNFTITVQFHQHATDIDDGKAELCGQLTPRFVLGRAWGSVIRKDNGKHVSTFLRISVAPWAAAEVISKLGMVSEIAQHSITNEYTNGRRSTVIGFTTKSPTRDRALNRAGVAAIAEKLGITLDDWNFEIKDNIVYASMPECNRKGDPIDKVPDAA